MKHLALALALALAACAAPTDPADPADPADPTGPADPRQAAQPGWAGLLPPTALAKADAAPSLPPRAIEVGVYQTRVPTGCTPTYGQSCTEAAVMIRIRVDDALLREAHPGFDGLEHAFALLPARGADGEVEWQGHAVPWDRISRHGYYGERTADVHQTGWLRGVDLEAIETWGVAVGLDTNVGLIWGQAPDENHPIAPLGVAPGYL